MLQLHLASFWQQIQGSHIETEKEWQESEVTMLPNYFN